MIDGTLRVFCFHFCLPGALVALILAFFYTQRPVSFVRLAFVNVGMCLPQPILISSHWFFCNFDFYLVLPSFTGFFLGFTGILMSETGLYWVELGWSGALTLMDASLSPRNMLSMVNGLKERLRRGGPRPLSCVTSIKQSVSIRNPHRTRSIKACGVCEWRFAIVTAISMREERPDPWFSQVATSSGTFRASLNFKTRLCNVVATSDARWRCANQNRGGPLGSTEFGNEKSKGAPKSR